MKGMGMVVTRKFNDKIYLRKDRRMKHSRTLILLAMSLLIMIGSIAEAGSIKGNVTYKKKKYLKHTVVYIDSVAGKFSPPKEAIVMNQENLVFSPKILPILAGTTVDFLNNDEVAHNVFTPDKSADKFNLGTWPKGEKRSYTFDKKCESTCEAVMLCNVHPEMEAFVVILQNPYFVVVDKDGSFEIKDIPKGDYNLKVWHPKLKSDSQEVSVVVEGMTEVTIALKK